MPSGNVINLLPSTSISAGATVAAPAVVGLSRWFDLFGIINVTAVPVGGAPTLDVYLQTSPDGGVTWQDILHHQFTTSSGARLFSISGEAAGPTTTVAPSDGALASDTVVQGPWGDQLRLKYVMVVGGSTGPYTFSASAVAKGG